MENARRARILVIDDEAAFTRMLRLTLPEHEIREENNPKRALQVAREWLPELILLDVVMPNMDGGDLAAALRADPELSQVPVIFLTAIVSPQEAVTRKSLGGHPLLAKPISAEALRQCIEDHLPARGGDSALGGLASRVVDHAKRLTELFTGRPA